MAESKIKDENFYQIQGWMINQLGLKGVALSVYAIIYGFTQDGETEYTGSVQYLCDFCGGVSRPTIIKALRDLTEKGYLHRREEFNNGVQFNRYKAILPPIKNFYGGSQETLRGVVKNFDGGCKETLHNNNIHSDIDTHSNNVRRFTPPTVADVRAYCDERRAGGHRNAVDPEKFVDYYTSNGWRVGKSPMKDWKAAVRNWERTSRTAKTYGANGVEIAPPASDDLAGIL